MKLLFRNNIAVYVIILLLCACNATATSAKSENSTIESNIVSQTLTEDNVTQATQEWIKGKVVFLNLEGGFYGIITDDGKHLLPMNLAKEFRQHNVPIKVKGKRLKGVMTIQQWGTPFKIADIELVNSGQL